jgi:hypothetical protein
MRNLRQIEIDFARHEIWALDVEGELWFGTLETSEDKRKVVNWSPVQLPPDGMSFSEPQRSFWDKMEKQARENYEASLEPARKAPAMAEEEQDVAGGTSGEVEGASDLDLEDGEGTDPGH